MEKFDTVDKAGIALWQKEVRKCRAGGFALDGREGIGQNGGEIKTDLDETSRESGKRKPIGEM